MPPRKSKTAESAAFKSKAPIPAQMIGFAVHLFTAIGAAAGFMALVAAFRGQFPIMFFWLGAALLIDGIDGTFARLAKVEETAPAYDGAALDLVIDYLTYVVVPAVAIWRSGLMQDDLALGLGLLVITASSLYFADRRMKMADHFFRGFPALWNVVALYLFVFRPPEWACATAIVALCLAMFLRIPFLHPMRVVKLRALSVAFTGVFLGSAALAMSQALNADGIAQAGLAASAAYFVAISAWRWRRDA